jgi:small subunit ribosomal protein S6
MSLYESVIIIRQETSPQQVEALADTYQDVIKENGGSIKKRENWGLRSLAYKIKKNRKGHYILFNIDAPSAAVHEMERLMSLNEDILRYLTLRVDEFEEGPSIPAQNVARNERSSTSYNSERTEKETSPEKMTDPKVVNKLEVDMEKNTEKELPANAEKEIVNGNSAEGEN